MAWWLAVGLALLGSVAGADLLSQELDEVDDLRASLTAPDGHRRLQAVRRILVLPTIPSSLRAPLAECLSDAQPEVRQAATLALGRDAETATPLFTQFERLAGDADHRVRAAALAVLAQHSPKPAEWTELWLARLSDSDGDVRQAALLGLARCGPAAGAHVGPVRARLRDPHPGVRLAACLALGHMGPAAEVAAPGLEPLLQAPETDLRFEAGLALFRIRGGSHGLDPFLSCLTDRRPEVVASLRQFLLDHLLEDGQVAPLIRALMGQAPAQGRHALVDMMTAAHPEAQPPVALYLIELLPDPERTQQAENGLVKLGARAVPALKDWERTGNPDQKVKAAAILRRIESAGSRTPSGRPRPPR
ncbi:MAG TPA: HEAT repeat domain-containing protein [Gemmatales bacterium]|nr:HEAT repeat domain-containing protein [Gemmatales bacterium]